MFSPPEVDEKDELYHVMILTLQCAYCGSFPNQYVELSDAITTGDLDGVEGLITQKGGRRKFRNTLATDTGSLLQQCRCVDHPKDLTLSKETPIRGWVEYLKFIYAEANAQISSHKPSQIISNFLRSRNFGVHQ